MESLAQLIAAAPAFADPLRSPVHGVLWLRNILRTGRGPWHLLDWDDVRIGDPAMDVATQLGPTAGDLTPLKMLDRVGPLLAPSTRERLPLLGRATLLDWVIDPISDWIDASGAPGLEDLVRPEKERVPALRWTPTEPGMVRVLPCAGYTREVGGQGVGHKPTAHRVRPPPIAWSARYFFPTCTNAARMSSGAPDA